MNPDQTFQSRQKIMQFYQFGFVCKHGFDWFERYVNNLHTGFCIRWVITIGKWYAQQKRK